MMGEVLEIRFDNQEDSIGYIVSGDSQSENFNLMQYTGLRDKKRGKDIYEGDIVVHGFGDVKGEVRFGTYETNGRAGDKDAHTGFYMHSKFGDAPLDPENVKRVIGNIHENPDLLQPEAEAVPPTHKNS